MVKEIVPVLLSYSVWGSLLTRNAVLFESDNSSMVVALLNRTANDNTVMHLHYVLWFLLPIMT